MKNIKRLVCGVKNFLEIFGDGDCFFGVIVLYMITIEFAFSIAIMIDFLI